MRELLLGSRARPAGRHVLYGGDERTLGRLLERLHAENPHLELDGSMAPPFGEVDDAQVSEVEALLVRLRPQFLWVGIGTPKQDQLAGRIAIPSASTVLTVGAAFDFLAGTKSEAPTWLQGTGFEWVHRLATEPRRLTRRYLRAATAVVVTAVHIVRHTRWMVSALGSPRCAQQPSVSRGR
jgi:N-acetylglucosaminyldiphosphoundecaprenol N-acetyl-beta-D-mannosaminyltransferase